MGRMGIGGTLYKRQLGGVTEFYCRFKKKKKTKQVSSDTERQGRFSL